jgi:hypothetical protein
VSEIRILPVVQFLGLNALDEQTSASQFAEDLGLTFNSIRDPGGELLASNPGVHPRALPSSIVIDKQGRVATRIIGPVEDGQPNVVLDEPLSGESSAYFSPIGLSNFHGPPSGAGVSDSAGHAVLPAR